MKTRWITFHEWGGEVVKGEEPKEGSYIPSPKILPTNIPMEHWKLVDGAIVEMTDEEKVVSDAICAGVPESVKNALVQEPEEKIHPVYTDILGMPEITEQPLEVIDIDEIIEELENKIYLNREVCINQIEQIEERLNKGDDKFKSIKVQLYECKDQICNDASDMQTRLDKDMAVLNDSYNSIIESDTDYILDHEKIHNNMMQHIKEQAQIIEQQKQFIAQNDARLCELERHPKVEKFFIVNNFSTKEYAQILLTSGLLYIVLKLIFH